MIFIFQKTEKVAFHKHLDICARTQAIITALTIKLNLKASKYTMEVLIQLILSRWMKPIHQHPFHGGKRKETAFHSGTGGKRARALAIHVVPVLLFQSGLPRGKGH